MRGREPVDLARAADQLNELISKRAAGRQAANAAEASWREPTRGRRQQLQLENGYAWAEHFDRLARAHHDLAASAASKADAVRESLGGGE